MSCGGSQPLSESDSEIAKVMKQRSAMYDQIFGL